MIDGSCFYGLHYRIIFTVRDPPQKYYDILKVYFICQARSKNQGRERLVGLGKGSVDRLGNFVAPVQITAQPQTNHMEKLR